MSIVPENGHAGKLARGVGDLATAGLAVFASMAMVAGGSPEVTVSRYRVIAGGQPSDRSEFTEFRRSDGSVTYLMVEIFDVGSTTVIAVIVVTH